MTNFMVGAMDNDLLKKLIDDEVPTFAMQSGMITSDFGWVFSAYSNIHFILVLRADRECLLSVGEHRTSTKWQGGPILSHIVVSFFFCCFPRV